MLKILEGKTKIGGIMGKKIILGIILIILVSWLLGVRVRFDKDFHKTHTSVKPSYSIMVYWYQSSKYIFLKEFIWTTEFGRKWIK